MSDPCAHLSPTRAAICRGTSGHAPEVRAKYLDRWRRKGLIPADGETPARSRGLGDTIAKITTAIGIKPCGGCKQRQDLLNELVPYTQPSEE